MTSIVRHAASALACALVAPCVALAQSGDPRLFPAGVESELPTVAANDNRSPAGTERDGVREISLQVVRADWRIETPRGPGLRVAAVAEAGEAPVVPAPLIRVEAGTRLRVRIHNALETSVSAFGLHERPAREAPEPLEIEPGTSRTVEFEAGQPGTYLYWLREGPEPSPDELGPGPNELGQEREQLAGAFVVDPVGGSPPDRILVMNIFSDEDESRPDDSAYLEGLTVNGLSWPFTERMALAVGEPVRWRVINASIRNHPMHLHGFYYDVVSLGNVTEDSIYAPEERRTVVTEFMRGRTTMVMEWTASRPGTWLFHCHLSFHVRPEIRLPGAAAADSEHHDVHMAGLVVGIEVAPGPSDLIAVGDPERVDLFVNEYGQDAGYRYGFALDADAVADSLTDAPGPTLVFRKHRAVDLTVHNRMSTPTGVHWHGLELDAWADGVPGWSRSDGRVSPAIAPGESFTYRLSLMRAGTFIYHTHLNDVDQLTGGLYGPLIVLDEDETFDPRTDHIYTLQWRTPDPQGLADIELNGRTEQPPVTATVGERHRFRIINIAPAGNITAWLFRGEESIPVTLLARDGADLPPSQRIAVTSPPRLGVGTTADFTWTPSEPGSYELRVGFSPDASFRQIWEVVPAGGPAGR